MGRSSSFSSIELDKFTGLPDSIQMELDGVNGLIALTSSAFAQDLVSNGQREIVFRSVNVIPMDRERAFSTFR